MTDLLRRKTVHLYKDDLWNAVLTAAKKVSSNEIDCWTSAMEQRLFSLVNKNGKYKQYWLYYEAILRMFAL